MTANEAMEIISEVWAEVSWSFSLPNGAHGGTDSVVAKTEFFNKLRPALNRQQRHDEEMEAIKKRLDEAQRKPPDTKSSFENIFGESIFKQGSK